MYFLCGYFPDPLRLKQFPLSPDSTYKEEFQGLKFMYEWRQQSVLFR